MPSFPGAISNTSPLLYLYRIDGVDWLHSLFAEVWTAGAVEHEFEDGRKLGYDVPNLAAYSWLEIKEPSMPLPPHIGRSLGAGERAVIALGLEYPGHVVLLDDGTARKVAAASGLAVWGTLRILLEAKGHGLVSTIAPLVDSLARAGMWMSEDIRERIFKLAGE